MDRSIRLKDAGVEQQPSLAPWICVFSVLPSTGLHTPAPPLSGPSLPFLEQIQSTIRILTRGLRSLLGLRSSPGRVHI
jgi:hypothetical protein